MSSELPSFTRLFNQMEEGMMIVDREWNIVFANDTARRYLHISPAEDRVRKELVSLFSGHYIISENIENIFKGGVESEESVMFEASSCPDISYRSVLSLYMSRPTEEGMRFLLLRDVTKERDNELLKSHFLSTISHKLMTPVTCAKLAIENLKDGIYGKIDDKKCEVLEKTREKLTVLEKAVNRLIKYSTLRTKEASGLSRDIDAALQLKAFCKKFGDGVKKKISFNVSADAIDDTKVRMDEESFKTILDCILENTVKFHRGDKINVDISFRRDPEKGELVISVGDDGPGIPPAIQKNVFREFTQRDDECTGNIEGMGLGLPLVDNIMRLSGGRVVLESDGSTGTALHLYFPAVIRR